MKKAEIQKQANAVLKDNPDVAKVFATSDGQIFLTENAANLHKTTNAKKKKLSVLEFSNTEVDAKTGGSESPVADLNVKDAAAFIATIETVEEVVAIAAADDRKGVKSAAEARINELNNPED